MSSLQKKVDELLDAAVFEAGYTDLMFQFPEEVALDLCTFSAVMRHEKVADVVPCVRDYQKWYQHDTATKLRHRSET